MKKALLFICIGLILTALSGCVKEKKMALIYVADVGNNRCVILDMDLNWIDSFSPSPTEVIDWHLSVDSTHIYVNESGGQLDKYLRTSPYTLITSNADPRSSDDIECDNDYVYIGIIRKVNAVNHYFIQRYNKSDLSFVDEFDTNLDGQPHGITVDETYIYCYETSILKKFKKSDHSEVASRDVLTEDGIYGWFGMDHDSTYLYFGAGESGNGELIAIYKKSDLSQFKVITIATTSYAWDVAVRGDYAYQVDYGAHVVRKVQISTGEVVATFGEEGVSGDDQSHLSNPRGISVSPEEEEAQPIIALIG